MTQNFKQLAYLMTFSSVLFCIGCQTTQSREQDLDRYLHTFIGQSSQQIQQQLNLKAMGYQTTNKAIATDNQLIYTILRPITIPVAGSNATIGNNAMGGPMIRYDTTAAEHYDVNFSCKVIFNLKNGIAESIDYQGKAC
ncbi:hypothetical protein [Acinetobacter sp. ANC 4648]|uniref:hypothetical protein n=1 Tax=Acinetobacter sp. ANC 4648 TaxID=1977875 RepID=UPI000B555220|nr:hypothetical protein [Acinetobacter sp. ANC 4648]OTG80625.1 hypothetical protein B9T27_12160 [Acinetobacter sp. ANC 4648]